MEISNQVNSVKFKLNTKFVDDFSKEIYEQTYKYGDEDINGTQLRVAKDLASIEKDQDHWTQEFAWALEDFKFVPGGRITSNAGTGLKGTTYINCFVPNTKVLTDKGYKAIIDIEVGDMVLTHKGRFRPVVSLMKKEHKDKVVSFESPFITNKLESTLEHPFYKGDNSWIDADFVSELFLLVENEAQKKILTIDLYEYVKDVKRNGETKKSIIADDNYVYSTFEWSNPNGGTIISRNKSKTKRFVEVNEEFAYFIGRYVGDGSTFNVNNQYEVDGFNIIFHNKEIDSQIAIKQIIDNAFEIETNINNSEQFDASYFRKNNMVVANFLKQRYDRYAELKTIPDFIWKSNQVIRKAFIKGVFDDDGTITSKEVKITLNNENLIDNLQALLLMCKIPSNKQIEYVKGKPYFRLSLVRKYASKLVKKSQKVYNDNRILEYCDEPKLQNDTQFVSDIVDQTNDNDGLIFSTSKIIKNEKQYQGFVYNISVLEDESYVVNNVIVHNCFVDGFMGEDQDSMEGILDALRRQALILKSEGGYGFCADVMRPRGSFIGGIGNESPGAVRMLDMWDTQSAVITEGSGNKTKKKKSKVKIRKGAQMVTMSVWHPDIEEYITSKQTPGRLTKFNMSVLVTDDFMTAVKNNQPWNLEFPDYEQHPEEYKKSWDGNIQKWKALGLSTTIHKTFENANQLWDVIMTSTYNRNEPGVLFVDTMNKLNNLYYCEHISATNPCGEQILPIGGVCLLGSINLTQFVDFNKKDWDYEKLGKLIPIAVRMMDNVNDKTYVPLQSQREGLKNKRRIGLGFLGYGSALMMLKVRYGSKPALDLTEKLMNFLANKAYQSSAIIASEKGAFPLYDEEKYLNSNFVKQALSEDNKALIKKHGIRNSHLLSIQPTGNSSVFANNVSGGLEPLFMPQYVRTSIMPYAPE